MQVDGGLRVHSGWMVQVAERVSSGPDKPSRGLRCMLTGPALVQLHAPAHLHERQCGQTAYRAATDDDSLARQIAHRVQESRILLRQRAGSLYRL